MRQHRPPPHHPNPQHDDHAAGHLGDPNRLGQKDRSQDHGAASSARIGAAAALTLVLVVLLVLDVAVPDYDINPGILLPLLGAILALLGLEASAFFWRGVR